MVYDSMLRSNHMTRQRHMMGNLSHASRDVSGMTVGYQKGAGFLSAVRSKLGRFGSTIKNFVANHHGVIGQVIKGIPSLIENVGKAASFVGDVTGKSDSKIGKTINTIANATTSASKTIGSKVKQIGETQSAKEIHRLADDFASGKHVTVKDALSLMTDAAKNDYKKYTEAQKAPIAAGPIAVAKSEKQGTGVKRKPKSADALNKQLASMLKGLKG